MSVVITAVVFLMRVTRNNLKRKFVDCFMKYYFIILCTYISGLDILET